MKELYSRTITDPSLKELDDFSKWYNEKIGNYPVIVGGWAVYCYTHGLGSKDIDVVFPGDETKQATLSAYFQSHGYIERSRSFFDKEFAKPVKAGKHEIEIIIDAVSSKRFIVIEGKNARLPWGWAAKHNVRYELENSMIYIPTIELLFVYKLGAVLGRNIKLKTGLDFDYYRSKLWKDVYDVLSLAKLKMESKEIEKFMVGSGLMDSKDEILQIIEDNFDDEIKMSAGVESLAGIKKIIGYNERG